MRTRTPSRPSHTHDAVLRWTFALAVAATAALPAARAADADWEILITGSKSMERAIAFAPDHETVWIAGLRTISRSVNGGKTWAVVATEASLGQAYWFNAIVAFSADEAIVSGFAYGKPDGGVLLRTTDGGLTWTQADAPHNGETQFGSVTFAPDGSVGYALSKRSGLLRSTDRGATWTPVKTPVARPLFVVTCQRLISFTDDGRTVWVWGHESVQRGDEGGTKWTNLSLGDLGKNWRVGVDLYFADNERGWVRAYGHGIPTLATVDGGKTWAVSNAPGFVQFDPYDPDKRRAHAYANFALHESADGGATWTPTHTFSAADRGGLFAVGFGKEYVFVVGGTEGIGHSFLARRRRADAAPVAVVESAVSLPFNAPADGYATLRVRDAQGAVVENVWAGQPVRSGPGRAGWNLETVDDFWPPFAKTKPYLFDPSPSAPRVAGTGRYAWDGLWAPALSPAYREAFYPIKQHGAPWLTPDGTGGWLGDHLPPNDVIAVDGHVWAGGFAEGGHSLLEADLSMRKLWGVARIQLACATVLAVDGPHLYFLDLGGWLGHGGQHLTVIQLERKTKKSRRFLTVAKDSPEAAWFGDIAGLAVRGDRAYLADHANNVVHVLDVSANRAGTSESVTRLHAVPLDTPGRMRPYKDGRLAIAAQTRVVLFDPITEKINTAVDGLTSAYGLDVDAQGRFYVGELDPVHQVRVFDANGKPLRTLGRPGPHDLGPFNRDNLESPRGVAVAADGKVWVAEASQEIKRTSVWDEQGHCAGEVVGPTEYGGSGAIDPENPNRFFYRGSEIVRRGDGTYAMANVIWRHDTKRYPAFVPERRGHNFNGPSPAHPFYRDGKLFFRMWGGYAMGDLTTLFVYDEAKKYVRPVAAVGEIQPWMREAFPLPADDTIFAWTDLDDNGAVDAKEIRTGRLEKMGAVWGVLMNERFEVAFSRPPGPVGVAFFEVERLTEAGYPVYRLPQRFRDAGFSVINPSHPQCVGMDAQGNAIVVSPYLFSMAPDGKINWRVKCRWPGLHAGVSSPAQGTEPGVLIAPLRIWGFVDTGAALGEVFALGTNYGVVDLFTVDGLYVGRAFRDSRTSRAWRYDAPPTPDELRDTSLGGEHFGGAFQTVRDAGGVQRPVFVVAAGGNTCAVVDLRGLDQAVRWKGGTFSVGAEEVARAQQNARQQAVETRVARQYAIRRVKNMRVDADLRDWGKTESIAGFRLGYDDDALYVAYHGEDALAPFQNAATEDGLPEVFITGDVLDVMLQTRADAPPKRTEAARGDVRLSFAMVGGQPRAILFDAVVPGTPKEKRHHFVSPGQSTVIDRIVRLDDAKVAVHRQNTRVTLEARVPFSALGWTPRAGDRIKGDVGRVESDQTGTTRIHRTYWSNQDTKTVMDLPTEARLQPGLWGEFQFE